LSATRIKTPGGLFLGRHGEADAAPKKRGWRLAVGGLESSQSESGAEIILWSRVAGFSP
jgi:hypothetical protein